MRESEDMQRLCRRRNLLFWECRHPKRPPMYFYGALHFGTPEMYPLPPQVEHAYELCDAVAFETDLDAISGIDFHNRLRTLGTTRDGDRLSDALSPETWSALAQTARELGYQPEYIDGCQSWYCASLLTSAALQRAGLASHLGIDGFIFSRATGTISPRKIITLETPETQLALLSGINNESDEDFINATIREVNDMDKFSHSLLKLWLDGNAAKLAALVSENFRTDNRQQSRMLTKRNRCWKNILADVNRAAQSVLTVIGAGHLVGTGNLVSLFLEDGYKLMPLNGGDKSAILS